MPAWENVFEKLLDRAKTTGGYGIQVQTAQPGQCQLEGCGKGVSGSPQLCASAHTEDTSISPMFTNESSLQSFFPLSKGGRCDNVTGQDLTLPFYWVSEAGIGQALPAA